jgi:hypothetical protein
MNAYEEAKTNKKIDDHFRRTHRQAPPGRDFRAFVEGDRSDINNEEFEKRYDMTFPNAPGNFQTMGNCYCSKCDRLKTMCICNKPL